MSHRIRLYILWSLVILTTLLTLWFDYSILFKKVSLYSGLVSEHRKEIQLLRSRMEFMPFFKNEERRIMHERRKLTRQATFSEGPAFLTYLDQTARETGNEISLSVQEKPTVIVSVQLEGSFNTLLDFLLLINQTDTLVQLTKITRSGSKGIKADLFLTPSFTSS